MDLKYPKIALAHDYLVQFGGAERVLEFLREIYPQAPIYTSAYNSQVMPRSIRAADIQTSVMQNFPFINYFFRWYFFFYPLAFEGFDLTAYDLILTSSSAYAKGIKKRKGQCHICYCHTPARFLYRYDDYIKRENLPFFVKSILPLFLGYVKKWDQENSRRVDYFIANSLNVAKRIKEAYGRDSTIIHPPIDGSVYNVSAIDKDYFLIVSRLNGYKRIDIAVEAFNQLGIQLLIIGDGSERKNLERAAKPNVRFLGRLGQGEVVKYYQESRALVFTGEEDFGLAPLEAMASGRPVIAYKAGGALETVIDGITGAFFEEQTAKSLIEAVNKFKFQVYDKRAIREHALKFDKETFKQKIKKFVEEKYEEFKTRHKKQDTNTK